MTATHTPLSVKDLDEIQAGPIISLATKSKAFVFFAITDVPKFRLLLKDILGDITTTAGARGGRAKVYAAKAAGKEKDLASLNVAFSHTGLARLKLGEDVHDDAFTQGQAARATSVLGDDKSKWLPEFKQEIHGLFEVTGNPFERVCQHMDNKLEHFGGSIKVIFRHVGKVRPGKEKGHEHFGYNDGISQPYVPIEDDPTQRRAPNPGQLVVNPGVIICKQNGDPEPKHPDWTLNGSFLVYRHLKQLVPEFDKFLEDTVVGTILEPPANPTPDQTVIKTHPEDIQERVDFLGARFFGRWKSGAPIVLSPDHDNKELGGNPQKNNNFQYPVDQVVCPFAAHIRKTGPRNDLHDIPPPPAPPSIETHSIVRGGITYGDEVTQREKDTHTTELERGLSFVAYQSSVPTGFEFIQQSWSNNTKFMFNKPQEPGFDPIIGQNEGQVRSMTGYDKADVTKSLKLPADWVVPQGGEYFFLPSMTTLQTILDIKD